jgi:hypothetical protein
MRVALADSSTVAYMTEVDLKTPRLPLPSDSPFALFRRILGLSNTGHSNATGNNKTHRRRLGPVGVRTVFEVTPVILPMQTMTSVSAKDKDTSEDEIKDDIRYRRTRDGRPSFGSQALGLEHEAATIVQKNARKSASRVSSFSNDNNIGVIIPATAALAHHQTPHIYINDGPLSHTTVGQVELGTSPSSVLSGNNSIAGGLAISVTVERVVVTDEPLR